MRALRVFDENGAVFYRGPSQLTGDPIIGLVTGLTVRSQNTKTGDMVQTWVLRDDLSPSEAINTGADDAICGNCPHRSGSNVGRSCYVVWWLGITGMWHARNRYPEIGARALSWRLRGRYIRFGSYGDPAAIPFTHWKGLAMFMEGWTGYTNQWQTCPLEYAELFMASVISDEEARDAHRAGYRSFRVRLAGEPLSDGEITCPASAEAGHKTTCRACRLCQGGAKPTSPNVAIIAHGQRAAWFGEA